MANNATTVSGVKTGVSAALAYVIVEIFRLTIPELATTTMALALATIIRTGISYFKHK